MTLAARAFLFTTAAILQRLAGREARGTHGKLSLIVPISIPKPKAACPLQARTCGHPRGGLLLLPRVSSRLPARRL